MQANAERAERIPGVGSIVGAGRRAAKVARGQADRHLGDVLGDVAGRGAQYALLRLSSAIKETIEEAPLKDAAMEIWDLQAAEPMSNLREYLSQQDLRDLVLIIHEIWLPLRDTEYFTAAVNAGIDVCFRLRILRRRRLLGELRSTTPAGDRHKVSGSARDRGDKGVGHARVDSPRAP